MKPGREPSVGRAPPSVPFIGRSGGQSNKIESALGGQVVRPVWPTVTSISFAQPIDEV